MALTIVYYGMIFLKYVIFYYGAWAFYQVMLAPLFNLFFNIFIGLNIHPDLLFFKIITTIVLPILFFYISSKFNLSPIALKGLGLAITIVWLVIIVPSPANVGDTSRLGEAATRHMWKAILLFVGFKFFSDVKGGD